MLEIILPRTSFSSVADLTEEMEHLLGGKFVTHGDEVPVTVTADALIITQRVLDALSAGQLKFREGEAKIHAVKYLKEICPNLTLTECKNFIEGLNS